MTAEPFLGWLLTYLVHSTALLAGAAALTRWAIESPAVREVVWRSALLAGLVTATGQSIGVGAFTSTYRVSTAAAREPSSLAAITEPTTTAASAPPAAPAPTEAGIVGSARASDTWSVAPADLAVAAWIGIAAMLVLWFAFQRWRLARRLGVRRPVVGHPIVAELALLRREAGIQRSVVLTRSDRLSSPIAVGVGEICVPGAALDGLGPDERRSLLAHELAHLVRFDPVWLTVAVLLERVFFFQPLNRLARRRLQADAELLCDEWAAARSGSGVAMARCLVTVAEWIDAAPRPVPMAGMAEERSQLVDRVQRLVEEGPMSVKPKRRLVVVGVLALVAVTAIMAPKVAVVGQDRRDDPDSAAAETASERGPVRVAVQDTGAVVNALIETLADSDAEVRRAAAQSLGQLRSRRAAAALVRATADESAEVRRAALEALGEIAAPGTAAAIAARLDDSDPEVRRAALDALDEFEKEVTPAMVRGALSDADPEVRAAAIGILGNLRDRSVAPDLIRLLGDRSPDVRMAAARALGELEAPAAAEPLAGLLRDEKAEVRQAAIEALDDLELTAAPSAVLEALADRNPEVRQAAAHLLGKLEDRRAVPGLTRLLSDQVAEVRQAAVEALSEIRDQAAIDALVAGLKSSDPVVRKAAAEALGQRPE